MVNNNLSIKQIKLLADNGKCIEAEKAILSYNSHSAEWNYVYSLILQKKGWFDSALNHLIAAINLDPNNKLYAENLEILESRHHNYSNNYYRTTRHHRHSSCCCCCCDCDDCDCCMKLWCADSCCECMGGDLIDL